MQTKSERKIEFAQVHYLDELVEMTTHKLTGKRSRKYLHLVRSKNLLSPGHHDPSIAPNIRRTGVELLLILITSPLPLPLRRDFFNKSSGGSRPHYLNARSNRKLM